MVEPTQSRPVSPGRRLAIGRLTRSMGGLAVSLAIGPVLGLWVGPVRGEGPVPRPAPGQATLPRPAQTATELLPARPRALAPLLARAMSRAEPVVALFTRPDCPWCEALRREQIGPLAREAGARSVQVVEFDVTDARPFEPFASGPPTTAESRLSAASQAWANARSPADLAARLKVSVTPTVVFLGGDSEIAERLLGYPSRDFYAAYLDDRIERAGAALRAGRR